MAAAATAEAISHGQKRAIAVTADVGDLGQLDAMVQQAIAAFGQIDITGQTYNVDCGIIPQ